MKKEKITLDYPITVDGVETDTLHMRRCRVSDIKALDKIAGDIEGTIYLVSALCEISPEAVESMDAADFMRVGEKVADFLPSAGTT